MRRSLYRSNRDLRLAERRLEAGRDRWGIQDDEPEWDDATDWDEDDTSDWEDDETGDWDDESSPGEEDSMAGGFGRDLPSSGLLSFYDRLRMRMVRRLESSRLGGQTAQALLLVPDVFVLLLRLSLDRRVQASDRTLLVGALAYFVLPLDLLPEMLVGSAGFLDDLILAVAVLARSMGGDLEPLAQKYWSGSPHLRITLRDLLVSADQLLGRSLYARLQAFLRRRGIDVQAA